MLISNVKICVKEKTLKPERNTTMDKEFMFGLGKIVLGTSAVGAGGLCIASGVGDIKSSRSRARLIADSAAESAAETAESMDLSDDGPEDDLPDDEPASDAE